MSVALEDLSWVLNSVSVGDVGALWDAKTRDQLDVEAARAMGFVWAWTVPRDARFPSSADEHARASLIAYVVSSTMHLRRSEFWDLP
jgi:hypothetical protein